MTRRLVLVRSRNSLILVTYDTPLDMNEGSIGSMQKLGITESYKLKRQVVLSASEAAEMIIRVDDILRASPRKREAV